MFDDTNLFEVTKFSGYDRIEIGTRANVGLQYTFQANDGGYARILAGESYHLAGTNPYADPGRNTNGLPAFDPDSGLQTDRSDYVLGAYVAPWSFMQLISQSRFDQSSFNLRRQDAGAQVTLGPIYASAVYAYLSDDPTNLDPSGGLTAQEDVYGSFNLRLTDRWSVGAAMRYDIDDDQIASDMFQVTLWRRVFRADGDLYRQLLRQPGYRRRPDADAALRAEASWRVRLFDRRAQRHGHQRAAVGWLTTDSRVRPCGRRVVVSASGRVWPSIRTAGHGTANVCVDKRADVPPDRPASSRARGPSMMTTRRTACSSAAERN